MGKSEETPLLTSESQDREAALRSWLREASKKAEDGRQATFFDDAEWRGIPAIRWVLGLGYMLAMGVCGIVLVALGSTLEDLAARCGTSSVEVGSVFIARGAGAMFGSAVSAKLYTAFKSQTIMALVLLTFAIVLTWLPLVKTVFSLHVSFTLLGICTAVLDTGCQIQTRKLHGVEAGPWLGANTVAFGISGALVPSLAYLTHSLMAQYVILSFVSLTVGALLYLPPTPRKEQLPPPAVKKTASSGEAKQTYEIETCLAIMVFWLVGGKVTATAYFTEFIQDTRILPFEDCALLIMVLWVAITFGRIAGIQDQRFLNRPRLYNHLCLFCLAGAIAMLLLLAFPSSRLVLWVGVGLYGFFNGPTVGYCYDLNNRLTVPSEVGMSIVMLGLNSGTSLVPYGTSLVWEYLGPFTLMWALLVSHLIPIPLLFLAAYLFDRKTKKEGLDVKDLVPTPTNTVKSKVVSSSAPTSAPLNKEAGDVKKPVKSAA